MKTLREIADVLKAAKQEQSITVTRLVAETGLTAVTLRGLLTAKTDPQLTTLMAVAEALGLELMLVPQAISASLAAAAQPDPIDVPTLVSSALKRRGTSK
jgi:transcriptional regulator with XRE-family HTH domain